MTLAEFLTSFMFYWFNDMVLLSLCSVCWWMWQRRQPAATIRSPTTTQYLQPRYTISRPANSVKAL